MLLSNENSFLISKFFLKIFDGKVYDGERYLTGKIFDGMTKFKTLIINLCACLLCSCFIYVHIYMYDYISDKIIYSYIKHFSLKRLKFKNDFLKMIRTLICFKKFSE